MSFVKKTNKNTLIVYLKLLQCGKSYTFVPQIDVV
jgi:hypothetical protein